MSRILAAGADLLDRPESRVLLQAKGYQLILCRQLQDAISLFLEDPPDLLLLEKGFADQGDLSLIKVAHACLQKANIPILLVVSPEDMAAGIDFRLYPVDDLVPRPVAADTLLARIQLAESRMNRVFDNNPLTRLPGNTSIIRAIQAAIDSDRPRAVGYVDIDNFKPYNDHYGFSQGDEVILMVARIIVNVIEELREEGFVGHVGGDDFVFVVSEARIQEVCEKILANFETVRNMFIEPADVKRGGFIEKDRQGRETRFGLLSLSIAAIPAGHGKFTHFGEVSAAASQIKHKVKALEGNNYLIDRREGYSPTS